MTVRIEKAGEVWTVINARPEARNAVDPDSSRALYDAFLAFEADPEARAAVFWGEGGAFCAGWDLKYAALLQDDAAFEREIAGGLPFPEDPAAPSRAPMGPSRLALSKPVIAAVEGPAVAGGMELAMWCDLRVMAEDAFMGVYCRRWGITLVDGGTVRLPRLVGQGRAMEITLTGRKVPARECLEIGLCERLAAPGEARAAAEALAREIARFPQGAVRADRRAIREGAGLSEAEALRAEWAGGVEAIRAEGTGGAARFEGGAGRHGDFERI